MTNLKRYWEAVLESVTSLESTVVGSDSYVHCHHWQWDAAYKMARKSLQQDWHSWVSNICYFS